MTPRSTAILTQLIGLTPQAKAEYTEARSDQQARKTVLVERSKTLRNGIVDAVMANDRDKARELIREAQKFDAANPAFAVLSDIDGAVKRRARVQAIAAATGTPIGTSPKDLTARDLTGYANVEFRPHR
jgi:hypothetical protein